LLDEIMLLFSVQKVICTLQNGALGISRLSLEGPFNLFWANVFFLLSRSPTS
jgi:hypothetical protein